jgi:hypothetical protein
MQCLRIPRCPQSESVLALCCCRNSGGLVLRAKLPQYWLSSLQNPEISGLIAIIDPANLASKKILMRRALLHVSSEALTVCPVTFGNGQCQNRPAYNARCSLIAGLLLSRFVRFVPRADVTNNFFMWSKGGRPLDQMALLKKHEPGYSVRALQ